MKAVFCCVCFFAMLQSFAQPPGVDDSIMAIKRKWVKKPPFVGAYDAQLKPSQFARIYKNTDVISSFMLQTFPEVKGAEPSWYTSINGKPYFNGGPSPYQYSAMFKYYFYAQGPKKIVRHEEPATGATIYVNGFRFLLQETGLAAFINGQEKNIYEVCNTEGEWKGYPVYRVNDNNYTNYRMILLANKGRLPWKPVSELEYLQAYRSMRLKETKKASDDMEKAIEQSKKELEKMKLNKQYKNAAGEKLIAVYEKTLDEQYGKRDKAIAGLTGLLEKDLKKMEGYIQAASREQLQKQAAVPLNSSHKIWNGFAAPSDKSAQKIVYVDEDYFDKSLASYEPQFITLTWYWMNATASLHFKKIFELDYPVEKLQAMLKGNVATGKVLTRQASKDSLLNSIKTAFNLFSGLPNNNSTWMLVKTKLADILHQAWVNGVISGSSVNEAFYIHIGTSSMTQAEINSGKLIADVGIAFSKPAEFESFRFEKQL